MLVKVVFGWGRVEIFLIRYFWVVSSVGVIFFGSWVVKIKKVLFKVWYWIEINIGLNNKD